jgi:hypothetical protein
MSLGRNITLLGVVFIVYYSLNQILSFYGVSASVYDVYYYFYAMLIIFVLILTNIDPTI